MYRSSYLLPVALQQEAMDHVAQLEKLALLAKWTGAGGNKLISDKLDHYSHDKSSCLKILVSSLIVNILPD